MSVSAQRHMSVSVGDTLDSNRGIDPVIVIKSIIQTISYATLKYIYNYIVRIPLLVSAHYLIWRGGSGGLPK